MDIPEAPAKPPKGMKPPEKAQMPEGKPPESRLYQELVELMEAFIFETELMELYEAGTDD